jgi:hypothetical protein
MLQALEALSVSRGSAQKAGMLLVASAMVFITVFAVPAG